MGMEQSRNFWREYTAIVGKWWWWLMISSVVASALGVIGLVWKSVRVPALVALIVGLLGVIAAQIIAAKQLWTRANERQASLEQEKDKLGKTLGPSRCRKRAEFGPNGRFWNDSRCSDCWQRDEHRSSGGTAS